MEAKKSQDPPPDTATRPFMDAADPAEPSLPSASETVDAGQQSSEPSAQTDSPRPETANGSVLLQAAEALELLGAQVQNLLDALRFLVDLGSEDRPTEFADIKRNLASAHAIIKSSIVKSPKVRELAIELRNLAAEEASLPSPIESSETQTAPIDGNIKGEKDASGRSGDVRRVIARSANNSKPADHVESGSTRKRQDEQKKVDMVLSEIEGLLGKPKIDTKTAFVVDPVPMPERN